MMKTNQQPSGLQRTARSCGQAVLGLLIVVLWLWCLLVLMYHPWLPGWLNVLAATGFAVVSAYCWLKLNDRHRALWCFCVIASLLLVFSILPSPSHKGAWSEAQATMPRATIDGDRVKIQGLRRTVHGFDGGHTIEHYDQTYNLGELQSAWFGVHYFSQLKSLAHTFVSFGFADGEYLSISIESRRDKGDGFSPIAGMFRNYGLIYVIGDEMEVIGWRSVHSGDPIYLYPIKANQQQMRAMLIDMLTRTNELTEEPEFYNTWTNNCTNNIVAHFNEVAPIRISPYDPRIAFPGHTGRLAFEHGLIDSEESFEKIQQQAHINELAQGVKEPENFSAAIRRGYAK